MLRHYATLPVIASLFITALVIAVSPRPIWYYGHSELEYQMRQIRGLAPQQPPGPEEPGGNLKMCLRAEPDGEAKHLQCVSPYGNIDNDCSYKGCSSGGPASCGNGVRWADTVETLRDVWYMTAEGNTTWAYVPATTPCWYTIQCTPGIYHEDRVCAAAVTVEPSETIGEPSDFPIPIQAGVCREPTEAEIYIAQNDPELSNLGCRECSGEEGLLVTGGSLSITTYQRIPCN